MEYQVGQTGRVIVARLFEGEDLYQSIEKIAADENIHAAAVLVTGGLRQAQVVVGPARETPKIVPNFKTFSGPGETLGVGTIYHDEHGPKLHIHNGIGRGDQHLVGCPRGGASVFLILEVTIIEITGVTARRVTDHDTGFSLLRAPGEPAS